MHQSQVLVAVLFVGNHCTLLVLLVTRLKADFDAFFVKGVEVMGLEGDNFAVAFLELEVHVGEVDDDVEGLRVDDVVDVLGRVELVRVALLVGDDVGVELQLDPEIGVLEIGGLASWVRPLGSEQEESLLNDLAELVLHLDHVARLVVEVGGGLEVDCGGALEGLVGDGVEVDDVEGLDEVLGHVEAEAAEEEAVEGGHSLLLDDLHLNPRSMKRGRGTWSFRGMARGSWW